MTEESRRLRRKARGYQVTAVLFVAAAVGWLMAAIAGCVIGDPWAWAYLVCFVLNVVFACLFGWAAHKAAAEAHRIEWQPILDHIAQIQAKLAEWRGES